MHLRHITIFVGFIICFVIVAVAGSAFAGYRIYRDQQGVVQIYADNNQDLFFAFGYWIGQDRLFQVEMRKHQALGRRAEFLGRTDDNRWANKFVEKDTETRRNLNLTGLNQQIEALRPEDRELLDAYARGLNKAIEDALANNGAKLPKGFVTYGFKPQHWTLTDVVATAADVLAFYSNFTVYDDNLALYKFLAKKYPQHCDDVFDALIWQHDPYAITTMNDQKPLDEATDVGSAKGCRAAAHMPNGLLALDKMQTFVSPDDPHFEPRRASMAWAVGKNRAEDANAIFLSGPQTGWHRPSYYYTVGLHGGDFDFIGMSPEGMPFFQVGFNRHYAWGMTAGLGMQANQLELQVKENGTSYARNGQIRPFEERQEIIKVKGEQDERLIVKNSGYGPVASEQNEIAYVTTFPWQGYEARSVVAWLRGAAAHSEQAWQHQAQNLAFNYNWFYADRYGKVGFAYTGRFPHRKPDADIRLPIAGDGSQDPEGYTDGQDTLVYTNEDVVYNFNNRPTIRQPNSGLYWEQWGRGHQAEILKSAIDQWPSKVTWADVQTLNRTISYTDVNWHVMKDIFRQATQGINSQSTLGLAAQAVMEWDGRRIDQDGDGYFDFPGLTIFDAWLKDVVGQTLGHIFEGSSDGAMGVGRYFIGNVHQRLPARLEEHPSGGTFATYRAFLGAAQTPGIPYHFDMFNGAKSMDVARQALVNVTEKLTSDKGSDLARWLTKATAQTYFPSNADRMPTSVVKASMNHGLYANRGGVNLMVEYGRDGNIARAAFANPLGGPEDQDLDAASDFHLDLYATHSFAPLNLVGEQDLNNTDDVRLLVDSK